jgi:adenylate cyclase
MGQEIERKFLVTGDAWRTAVKQSKRVVQGYVARGSAAVVRVRAIGAEAFLTIKSAAPGLVRAEFEYEIPMRDAEQLLRSSGALIEKTRHDVAWDGLMWSVDELHGALAGFVLAELELVSEDQAAAPPPWA